MKAKKTLIFFTWVIVDQRFDPLIRFFSFAGHTLEIGVKSERIDGEHKIRHISVPEMKKKLILTQ